MERALIILNSGKTVHVYLHQEIDNFGGRWATAGPKNSDTGYSLYRSDGRVVKERYDAKTNERVESKRLIGASWRSLVTAEPYPT
jgi:hypothetical protein